MKGFGTNEKELIRVLSALDPLQANSVRITYPQVHKGRDLEKDITSETSRYFKDGLVSIVRGPLLSDAHNVRDAVAGAGTNEDLLNHVVLGRSNADLRAIKEAYRAEFKRTLETDVDNDLSMKTKDLFRIVLRANRAEEYTHVIPHEVDRDVNELHRAVNSTGEQLAICNIIAMRSSGQLRAIAQAYEKANRKPLRDALSKKFDGHMKDALLLMLDRATDPVMSDAVQLEAAMAGLGTKDKLLVARVITTHWNREHKDQVKRAYVHRFKRDLVERIRGETSGDYRNLLVALMQ
jgi:annexin A7/11